MGVGKEVEGVIEGKCNWGWEKEKMGQIRANVFGGGKRRRWGK